MNPHRIEPPLPDLRDTRPRKDAVVITDICGFHQLDRFSCGAAAAATIAYAYSGGLNPESWFTILRHSRPSPGEGTPTRRLRRALHELGLRTSMSQTFTPEAVSEIIRKGDLLITTVKMRGSPHDSTHWVVVAGCSPREVLILNSTGLPFATKRWMPWEEVAQRRHHREGLIRVHTGLKSWVSDQYPADADTSPDRTCSALTAIEAVREAAAYLRHCGITLPRFRITAEPGPLPYGGSFVTGLGGTMRVNIGRYPTRFLRNWFAMHELGHVLWRHHRPDRWKHFRQEFGKPKPDNYEGMALRYGWRTAGAYKLSWLPGPHRPKGEPSVYGIRGGGQERFCELLGLMWAHGDFSKDPPRDLASLWDTCWEHGLSRMA